jgi:hypothetical protein
MEECFFLTYFLIGEPEARAGHYFYPVKVILYFTGARCEAIGNSLKKLL